MIAISSKKHSTTAAVQNRGGTAPLRRGNGPGARYSSKIEGERPRGPIYIGRSKTNSIIALI